MRPSLFISRDICYDRIKLPGGENSGVKRALKEGKKRQIASVVIIGREVFEKVFLFSVLGQCVATFATGGVK